MKKCSKCGEILDYRKIDKDFISIGARGGRKRVCYKCYFTNRKSHRVPLYIMAVIFFVVIGLGFLYLEYLDKHSLRYLDLKYLEDNNSWALYVVIFWTISLIYILSHIYYEINFFNKNMKHYNILQKSAKYQDHLGIERIDEVSYMTGEDFEQFCGNLFILLGYEVTYTPTSNDYGVDIIIKKNLESIAVQTKRYAKPVGVKAVQEVFAGMHHYSLSHGLVVTSAKYYTNQAVMLAKSCNIELWTLNDLIYHVKSIS